MVFARYSRHRYHKLRAVAWATFYCQRMVLLASERLRDGKAEAMSGCIAACASSVSSIKPVEYTVNVGGCNANTVVFDVQYQ